MTWIEEELNALQHSGLKRQLTAYAESGGVINVNGNRVLNLASNDYLNLAHHPLVKNYARDAIETYGAGSGSSRLVSGNLPIHEVLEHKLAEHKGYAAALVFGSGYAANMGTICALVGRGDRIFADKLSHASIIDAAVLSRATLHRFRHNDSSHLDELMKNAASGGRDLVITESVFSMDGDVAPLKDIVAIAMRHNSMVMVDEAHATGVIGPTGCGLVGALGLQKQVTVCMGTLSKALGSYGGFVACSALIRDLLVNRARSFIYSTALSPPAVGAALGALEVLNAEPSLGGVLLANANALRERLLAAGLNTLRSESQIIPVIVGDNINAVAAAEALMKRGVIAAAIRPPTVPAHTARLRLSVTLAHTTADLEKVAEETTRAIL